MIDQKHIYEDIRNLTIGKNKNALVKHHLETIILILKIRKC